MAYNLFYKNWTTVDVVAVDRRVVANYFALQVVTLHTRSEVKLLCELPTEIGGETVGVVGVSGVQSLTTLNGLLSTKMMVTPLL